MKKLKLQRILSEAIRGGQKIGDDEGLGPAPGEVDWRTVERAPGLSKQEFMAKYPGLSAGALENLLHGDRDIQGNVDAYRDEMPEGIDFEELAQDLHATFDSDIKGLNFTDWTSSPEGIQRAKQANAQRHGGSDAFADFEGDEDISEEEEQAEVSRSKQRYKDRAAHQARMPSMAQVAQRSRATSATAHPEVNPRAPTEHSLARLQEPKRFEATAPRGPTSLRKKKVR